MAESVLFSTVETIIGCLSSLASKEIRLIWGAKDFKLKSTVSKFKAVLLDARDWLQKLEDAVFAAGDFPNDISPEDLLREMMSRDKMAKKVCFIFFKSNQLVYGRKLGHEIKAIREMFDAIEADRKFYLEKRDGETGVRKRKTNDTYSFIYAEDVIGREIDKKAIIDILMDPKGEGASFIPIAGMGGLGKNRFAQLIFNDENMQKYFQLKIWVYVFDVTVSIRKKYLLVLDDVWNEVSGERLRVEQLLMMVQEAIEY